MEGYHTIVGTLAHRAVAEIAREGRAPGLPWLTERTWQVAGALVRERSELGSRSRAARLVVAGVAAVYARYLLPPTTWRMDGAEVPFDGGRIDLVWHTDTGQVVYDELKLAGALGRPKGDGPTRRQTGAYLAHGTRQYGEAFGGVRLLLLGNPRHSMLVGPGDHLVRLTESPMWFEGIEGWPA